MEKITAAAVSARNILGQPEAALADMERWIEKARLQGAELVLFPELNITGYIQNTVARRFAEPIPGPSSEKVIELARRAGVTLACGILEREGDAYYCTHILANGDGLLGKQRKIHTPTQEQPAWGFGGSIQVFDTGKARVGISVCRDSFFDEMTRTLYSKGAEVVLMPFSYNSAPRNCYLKESIHGMSIIKAAWTNGFYTVFCNSAGDRLPGEWEPEGSHFTGWAGVIDPWGIVRAYTDDEGNDERMVVMELDPEILDDRRSHPNFLAKELRPELYQFSKNVPRSEQRNSTG